MNSRLVCSALAALLFSFAKTGVAHHASAPHFDSTKSVEFSGVVSEFKLVNPHAYLYVDVTDENENVETWNCEMNSASTMRRFGWNQELFSPGTKISVEGWAARRDELGCAFQKGTLGDGTVVLRAGTITTLDKTEIASNESSEAEAVDVDLSSVAGTWVNVQPEGPPSGIGPWTDIEDVYKQMTDAGIAASKGYDMRFDDPALECSPSSIIRVWGEPSSVSEITLSEAQVMIKHAYMDTVRTIDLTTSSHPENIEPSLTGHSIGRFEDGDLIIETVGFAPGVLLPHPGVLNSDKLRIIETISLEEGGTHLQNIAEIYDESFLTEPLQTEVYWTRTNETLTEYNCVELSGKNNERPSS